MAFPLELQRESHRLLTRPERLALMKLIRVHLCSSVVHSPFAA
jgi:hypothetical protein